MSAVSEEIKEKAVASSGMNGLLSELGVEKIPRDFGDHSLVKQRQSLTMTVPSDAWQHAGHELENAGDVQVYWLKELDLLLVDLSHE